MSGSHVYRPRARPDAALRLFCFTPAGYGASIYREWGDAMPAHVEVCAIRLPGRENVRFEPALTSFAEVRRRAVEIVEPYLDRPYAVFGHSMGAVLAFETARVLRERGAPPTRIFVSGRRAPHVEAQRLRIHDLPQDELIAEIQRRYNGIPPALLNEPELLALSLPVLRADLAALESYEYVEQPPFDVPLFCYAGTEDHELPLRDLEAWTLHTRGPFTLRRFRGDHFYLLGSEGSRLRSEIAMELG